MGKNNTKKANSILIAAALTIIAAGVFAGLQSTPFIKKQIDAMKPFMVEPGFYKVTQVYDGDTIAVSMDGRTEKIRMIGVDTPETQKPNSPVECFGFAASDFTKKQLTGQTVRLEADPINQNRDRFDRLLRYVYLQDGTDYNAEIIKQGYGFAYLSFPFTKADEYREYQKAARLANKGLWAGECTITDQNGRNKTNGL